MKPQLDLEKQLSQVFFQLGAALAQDEEHIQHLISKLDSVLNQLISVPKFKYVEDMFGLQEYEMRLIALVYIQELEPDILTPYIGLSWYENGPTLSLDKLLYLSKQGNKRALLSKGGLRMKVFEWQLLQCGPSQSLTERVVIHSGLLHFLLTGSLNLKEDHPIALDSCASQDTVFESCLNVLDIDLSDRQFFQFDTRNTDLICWYTEQLAVHESALFGFFHSERLQQMGYAGLVCSLVDVILCANGKPIFLFASDLNCVSPVVFESLNKLDMSVANLSFFTPLICEHAEARAYCKTIKLNKPSTTSLVDAWQMLSPIPNEVRSTAITARYPIPLHRMSALADTAKKEEQSGADFWDALQLLCLRELNTGPEELAKLAEPRFKISDMVLSPHVASQLRELVGRVDKKAELHAQLPRFMPGCKALFWGKPGTGKSMAAEAIAGDLQLPLYVVNLANIASKWIGETEKHLEKLFDQAQEHNAVLMFDEADAVFAKRSAVESSQDKNANTGVSYLLQKIEHYSGLLLLSTNLKSNLDDAFLRRFHNVIEFTLPTPAHRELLWRQALSKNANNDLMNSITSLAHRFELTAAQILNITESALLQRLMIDHKDIDPESLANALKRELSKQHEGFMAQHEIKAWLQGN
ncbi:ATP-binding protein [Pseudoalteromonas luteoviolacea]|uniref:ATP-binding protein n=1 Tax=Pseudoalteromonas luteoviolacea TaxID=43657 RepID=UPI001F2737C9|nr:ATP-binding protein [Pseudoalteromonas luteoviolacea]MCF6440856.1 ATP-binding protein [Pseudoalteromonas luteoviolacea]